MPEGFYRAARFAHLEHAGESYFPVQEMLRTDRDNDLSVFRFQLGGEVHVAVVGTEPPAPLREAIQHALVLGVPVALPEDVVQWLFQRREERKLPEGFTEGHYTRETGPRPGKGPRRRGSTLPVTWEEEVPSPGEAAGTITDLRSGQVFQLEPPFSGVCDWCTGELASPVAAVHNFAVELEFPDWFTTATGGKWATCSMCRGRLKLKPGEIQVAFEAVDRLWRSHWARYLGENVRLLKVHTFYHEEGG